MLIYIKNYIAHAQLWIDDFQMITVEVKGSDPKYTWQIIGIYTVRDRVGDREIGSTNHTFVKFTEVKHDRR